MRYFKITNLVEPDGKYNYKGLDIDAFIAGSQVYSQDGKTCVIATTQDVDIPVNQDILELTEAAYATERDAMQVPVPNPLETRISELEGQNAQMILALVNGGLL